MRQHRPIDHDHHSGIMPSTWHDSSPAITHQLVRRVATQFGRPTETIRTWLARARKEGWLAPAVKGRAGGEPGPKLLVYRMAHDSGVPAPEVGVHIPDDETDAQREAREQRMYDFAEDAGKLWEDLRGPDSE
ncbi:hypothetical protein ACIP68_13125, partial [Streptomyces griseoviridis]